MGVIRILLAISVLSAHAGDIVPHLNLAGGTMAVEMFFVISGFYMALILNEKYKTGPNLTESGARKLFWVSRALRIYPAYWVMLLATFLLQLHGYLHSHAGPPGAGIGTYFAQWPTLSGLTRIELIAGNIALIGQDWLMFAAYNPQTGHLYYTAHFAQELIPAYRFLFIPPTWTLGVELTFYILAPFIVTRRPLILACIAIPSFLLRAVLYHFGYDNDPWIYRFFPVELSVFLLGSIAYRGYAYLRESTIFRPIYGWIAFAVALLLIVTATSLPRGLISQLYLVAFAAAVPFIFLLTKRSEIDTKIGELSYPVYISQIFAMQLIAHFTRVTGLSLTVVTIIIASGLLAAVDRPIDRYRHRMVERRKRGETSAVDHKLAADIHLAQSPGSSSPTSQSKEPISR